MGLRKLSPELQQKAIIELNEVPERIPDDIKHIKEWLKKQPHIKARTDDQWLLTFLRGCKFSLEKTKEKIDMFYTMRTILPEFFKNRDPFDSKIQKILKMGLAFPLKNNDDPTAPVVIFIRQPQVDPKELDLLTYFKVNTMMLDIALIENDTFIVAGERLFQDMEGTNMAFMTAISPTIMKKMMMYFQEACPVRIKGVHYVNIPSFFETLFNMFKPFMNKKMTERMVVHTKNNYEELYKVIPRKILPNEYGGEAGPIEKLAADFQNKIESYAGWFKEDLKYGTNEQLRPGKPKTADNMFGVEGSFRKLNVD